MKLILLALSCVAFALIVTACTETATPTNSSTPRSAAPSAAASPSASVDALVTARTNYAKNCEGCHGPHGEGAQQGRLRFPPLLDVAAKPRRTTEDIVGLLKDPAAYGLQPPMRSFKDNLTEDQMREIAAWIVQLKRVQPEH